MNIGIDIQALQTPSSKNRGIGRYSTQLFYTMIQLDKFNQYTCFINDYYPTPTDLPKTNNIKVENIHYVSSDKSSKYSRLNEISQFLQFYASNQDILHLSSPFEWWSDEHPVVNRYSSRLNAALAVTLYDLIPLIFSQTYLTDEKTRQFYFTRLQLLKQCDMIFSISESSRLDAINLLGIEPEKIINIGAASSEQFKKIDVSEKIKQNIQKKYSIPGTFVLYTGGIDFRKNLNRVIEAFSKIDPSLLQKYYFVIVCKASKEEKQELEMTAKKFGILEKIIIPGYIPDSDLNILYNTCTLFIFPSLYEGSGLPILEAMNAGAPVISSNTSSMPEIVGEDEFMFNPYNVDEMAVMISRSLTDDSFITKLKKNSISRIKEFAWSKTATKVLEQYSKMTELIQDKKFRNSNLGLKPSLAYFSPVPPMKSGISEYSKRLLPHLIKYYDIDLFIDDYEPSQELKYSLNWKLAYNFDICNKLEKYDYILYHMGNSEYHFYMLDILKKNRGTLVLHDMYLGPMLYQRSYLNDIKENTSGKLDFFDAIEYSHGDIGKKYASDLREGKMPLDKIFDELSLAKKIIDDSNGIIVHSDWSKNKLKELFPNLKLEIKKVNHNNPPILSYDKRKVRKELGLGNEFLIGSFGIVGGPKKIDVVIKNLSNFLRDKDDARFLIVGQMDNSWRTRISELVRDLKLQNKVQTIGYLDFDIYKKYLSSVDVAINLRYPTRGETSGSVLDLLRAGIPTMISNDGPISEVPDDCVIKVNIGEEKKLDKIINDMYNDKTIRHNLSRNAKQYSDKTNNVDLCALQYEQVLTCFKKYKINNDNLEDKLLNFIAKEIAESGIKDIDQTSQDFLASIIHETLEKIHKN